MLWNSTQQTKHERTTRHAKYCTTQSSYVLFCNDLDPTQIPGTRIRAG